ncbi:MAG: cytochrome c, partial [Acidobacteriota bacterium]
MQILLFFLATALLVAQDVNPGRILFENRCARCHGADGAGGERAPAITGRLASRDDQQLSALVRQGLPVRGMPANAINDSEMTQLTRFLRTLQPSAPKPLPRLQVVT